MATESILPILGYRGEPVPNRFQRPREARDGFAILLPGFGYTLDMPLFYYAENLLLEQGWDVLRVEYAYTRRPDYRRLPEAERMQWLVEDATAAYRAGCAQGAYERIALIGKSLGTLAMGHLLTLADQPAAALQAVWLTPVLEDARLREQIVSYGGPSLFVIGTADDYFNSTRLDELCHAANGDSVIIDGADHGLDIPGDPVASVRAVEQAIVALVRFLSPHHDERRDLS